MILASRMCLLGCITILGESAPVYPHDYPRVGKQKVGLLKAFDIFKSAPC